MRSVEGAPLWPPMLRPALLALALLAAPASGQPAPDVVGTWELVSSRDVPVDDALVFARLTFTGDRLDAVYVFLDPDDGELSGRFERARYIVSAGQLVVRENNQTTVLAVERDGTLLQVHDLETGTILLLREASASDALDPDLVGTWAGVRGGERFAVRFGPDGEADVREGDDLDAGRYVVAGPYVLLGDDPARYTFERGPDGQRRLVVEADGERSILDRADAP